MSFYPTTNTIIKKKYKFYSKKLFYNNAYLEKTNFCIISNSFCLISLTQLLTLKKYILKRILKKRFYYFKVSLLATLFKKSSKARMGKGIGKFYKWFGYIKPGMVIFEFTSYTKYLKNHMNYFKHYKSKMPFKCSLQYKKLIFDHKNYF